MCACGRRATRRVAFGAGALVLSALATGCARETAAAPATRVAQVQRELSRACDPPPPGPFPVDFPPVPLPDGAAIVAPAGEARPGMERVDLVSSDDVKDVYEFFLEALDEAPGFVIVTREFEGVDAEVFFGFGRRLGTVMIVSSCEGSAVAIEAEVRARR